MEITVTAVMVTSKAKTLADDPDLDRQQLNVARASLHATIAIGIVTLIVTVLTVEPVRNLILDLVPRQGSQVHNETVVEPAIPAEVSEFRAEPLSRSNGPANFDEDLAGLPLVVRPPVTGRWHTIICQGDVIAMIDSALPADEDLIASLEQAHTLRVRPQGHLDDVPSASIVVTPATPRRC